MLDFAIAAIDHGEALDLALAGGLGDKVGHSTFMPLGFCLHTGVLLQSLFRCPARQHQPVMLGDEAALAIEQPEFCSVAQLPYHRAGRVRHVGVERRAEERQSARHRWLYI